VRAVVFCAGIVEDYVRIRSFLGALDLVICADGGIRHAFALGLRPALVLGDFDSAGQALAAEMESQGIPVHRVPVEKDQTDSQLALEEAIRRGADEILLVGATGGRLDHTVANLLLLPGLPASTTVSIVDSHNLVRLLRPGGRLTVPALPGSYLSLLPLSPEVKGVVAEGVKWPLDGVTLRWGESLGVSNQILADEAFLAIREGYLLVIQAWD
jgi:thiamine pyrophosphokinase